MPDILYIVRKKDDQTVEVFSRPVSIRATNHCPENRHVREQVLAECIPVLTFSISIMKRNYKYFEGTSIFDYTSAPSNDRC